MSKSKIPAFMYPAVSKMLLAVSRQRHVKRELERALRQQGWSDSACAELAEIHINLPKEQPHAPA